jgi:preprotein translocase subunit SecY
VLSNLKNIFKVADLRNKIIFTLFVVLVYRFGVALRVPGVDAGAVRQLREASKSQGALGFLNLFSGGAFGSFSIFASSNVARGARDRKDDSCREPCFWGVCSPS